MWSLLKNYAASLVDLTQDQAIRAIAASAQIDGITHQKLALLTETFDGHLQKKVTVVNWHEFAFPRGELELVDMLKRDFKLVQKEGSMDREETGDGAFLSQDAVKESAHISTTQTPEITEALRRMKILKLSPSDINDSEKALSIALGALGKKTNLKKYVESVKLEKERVARTLEKSGTFEEKEERSTECLMCGRDYDTSVLKRRPMRLRCSHNFCYGCLYSMAQKNRGKYFECVHVHCKQKTRSLYPDSPMKGLGIDFNLEDYINDCTMITIGLKVLASGTGQLIELRIPPAHVCSINRLKDEVGIRTGEKPMNVRLYLKDKELCDGTKLLSDLGIHDGTELGLTFRLRGGGPIIVTDSIRPERSQSRRNRRSIFSSRVPSGRDSLRVVDAAAPSSGRNSSNLNDVVTSNYQLVSSDFHPEFNFNFSGIDPARDGRYSRGGEPYTRPCRAWRKAIKVLGIYDDARWLGKTDDANVWMNAYHGTRAQNIQSILDSGLRPGPRAAYGNGVYATPDPNVAKSYAPSVTVDGIRLRVIFQCRVRPGSFHKEHNDRYWVIPNGADVRPYGVCFFRA